MDCNASFPTALTSMPEARNAFSEIPLDPNKLQRLGGTGKCLATPQNTKELL
jgi:hypothetical protein